MLIKLRFLQPNLFSATFNIASMTNLYKCSTNTTRVSSQVVIIPLERERTQVEPAQGFWIRKAYCSWQRIKVTSDIQHLLLNIMTQKYTYSEKCMQHLVLKINHISQRPLGLAVFLATHIRMRSGLIHQFPLWGELVFLQQPYIYIYIYIYIYTHIRNSLTNKKQDKNQCYQTSSN